MEGMRFERRTQESRTGKPTAGAVRPTTRVFPSGFERVRILVGNVQPSPEGALEHD